MADMVGNVRRERYEQIVAEGRDLTEQLTKCQFALGDRALEIEPMREQGIQPPRETTFTVDESLTMFAADIGVSLSAVDKWRWTASRWPAEHRRARVSFTVHRILAHIEDEDERFAMIDDPPVGERTGRRAWTPDAAKRRVGHRVERPVTVVEKAQAVTDLTRDESVAAVTGDLLRRPDLTARMPAEERVRVVEEFTRDEDVASQVTTGLLRRPAVARQVMRDDTARFSVNRAQFDNSEKVRHEIRERTPAVRAIEHTMEYLDLVASCHQFVASLGRLVPRLRGQKFTDDEREALRRGIAKVRTASDWLEAAVDSGEFTRDEQLASLLKGE
ncbi:DUF6192 family protein [Streptomyces halobius]|uniref:DUF6192 family protein n=1 Tax=Streptomyces halobius TaxID=2879846 RepID=A0ABY4MH61_9ACTN|nr:DUF6192 family protein [Streptomyces halobius]UQA96602.1 DUF6192 family protein [Streptomyces halobius]